LRRVSELLRAASQISFELTILSRFWPDCSGGCRNSSGHRKINDFSALQSGVVRHYRHQFTAIGTFSNRKHPQTGVKIVNRKKLEDSACECYGVIQQYDGELGLR
jgi:hypothetical protein